MNLSRIFILRPVATSLLMIAILIAGTVAAGLLPVAALPSVDTPTIQVLTFYPGASPDVMTSSITAPLERQFGQMPGLNRMISASAAGASMVTLQFNLDLSLDEAEQEVQAAINAAGNLLPGDLPAPPIYAKINPADAPVMTLAVTSATLPLTELENLSETRLAQKISQQPGVGLVNIGGGQRPAVRVKANPRALTAFGLNIDDLRSTIANANVNTPKGNFDGPRQASSIDANDQLKSPEDFRRIVVAYRNGAPVRLSDVANVVLGPENSRLAAWANASPAIILDVRRQPGANVIQVADGLKALLPRLEAVLPAGVDVAVLSDRTTTVRASIADAEFELALAVALVVLVIFVFLRNLPATIVPSLSVPLSLIGTLAAMYLMGFSIDNLSLMALTVATGFVVDDAIVMIENITRFVENGMPPLEAALRGSRQIGFTILSLTLSLIAVLIPLLFMGDVVGRLFHEFALTLAVAIAISAAVSLTLVPMLCARLIRHRPQAQLSRFDALAGRGFDGLARLYGRALARVLDHQPLTLLVALLTLCLALWLAVAMPKGFFPAQDTGLIQGISEAAQDVSFAAMAQHQQALAQAILADPDVESLSSSIGVDGTNATLNSGRFLISLKPHDQRAQSAAAIARRLAEATSHVAGVTLALQPVQDLTVDATVSRAPYAFVLADVDAAELRTWAPRLVAALNRRPELAEVASDLEQQGRTVDIAIDRATASRFGITPATVDNALYDAFGQRIVSTIYTRSNQYRVILEADADAQTSLAGLAALHLPSSLGAGKQVPLSAIAEVKQRTGPLQNVRFGQFPATVVSFDAAPGVSLGAAVEAIRQVQREIGLPRGVSLVFRGTAAAFQASLGNETALLIAAVLTMYIVLGVLYESTIHPLTILSTLPSAGIGALLGLRLMGDDLDIIAVIGIVLLIGIVKKNAILMVDFALDAERQQGMRPRQAIYEACLLRLRPILMTTLAAMLGALPLLVGSGTGAEIRQPLGAAIVGGLAVSQVLTLFTTPVIYLMFDRLGRRQGRRQGRRHLRFRAGPLRGGDGA